MLPRLRLEPRLQPVSQTEWFVRVGLGVCVALAAGWLVIALAGFDPVKAYGALWRGGFGSLRAISATLNKAVPIGLCALAIALAHRARLWIIGAEGQLYFGAFAAAGVGLYLPPATPAILAIPLVLIAGMLGGAAWAALAALPRAFLGVNEILTTLMLTYVAILWVDYLVVGPWGDPATFTFAFSPPIVPGAQIGRMVGTVHWGVVLLILAAAVLVAIDRGLRWGYELRVLGDAPRAARYGGISAATLIVSVMLAAGAFAGLAGAIELAASTTRLQSGLSPGYGFMGILVAWLANTRAVPILVAAVLYAGLLNGGFSVQIAGIPPAISTILQASLLIGVLASVGLARYRLRIVATGRIGA